MKCTEAILFIGLALGLTGCALGGAPKIAKATPPPPKPEVAPPPPPPQPLSIPQTHVELPKPQPLDPDALATPPPQPEPPPEPATSRAPRRPSSGPQIPVPPKPEATIPPAPEPEPRPAIQEIVPAAEQKRLHDSMEQRKAEINQILEQFANRRQTSLQKSEVRTIRVFLDLAEEADKHGDFKQADGLAERAQILARELQAGK